MRILLNVLIVVCLGFSLASGTASDKFPSLKVGDDVYSNVTVMTVTATDIYFSHSKGMGNAKLKSLIPELQKQFKFDPIKGNEAEQKQAISTALFQMTIAAQAKEDKLRPKPGEEVPPVEISDEGDPVAPKLYAKSFRGGPPPQVIFEKWITPAPSIEGKFVLLDFWATWCGPCRRSIPHLNDLQAKFRDQLVIIGLSDESEADIRKLKEPRINYAIATDSLGRMKQAVEVVGIPHTMLIDPKGIVRFEGLPNYLDEAALEKLIAKYSD